MGRDVCPRYVAVWVESTLLIASVVAEEDEAEDFARRAQDVLASECYIKANIHVTDHAYSLPSGGSYSHRAHSGSRTRARACRRRADNRDTFPTEDAVAEEEAQPPDHTVACVVHRRTSPKTACEPLQYRSRPT